MSGRQEVVVAYGKPAGGGLVLTPGKNLVTGETAFRRHFMGAPTSLEEDLLTLASAIFAADLAFRREDREQWPRSLLLRIPVVNYAALKPIRDSIENVLFELSGDSWTLEFQRKDGTPEATHAWPAADGTTLLFSGGLDSLAQAVTLAGSSCAGLLVSHDSGSTPIAQGQMVLAAEIKKISKGMLKHLSFRVRPQNQKRGLPFPTDKEPSQRTRSFLFLTLAVLSARRSGHHRIVMVAENGQMAIHLPLTEARIGGFSTRTAHPGVLARVGDLMSELLGVEFQIVNPLLYKTKAQVVADLCTNHASLVKHSLSCWMTSRLTGKYRHCGDCVPCIVRRIALETNGPTAREWVRDIFCEPLRRLGDDDTGKRNMMELLEFVVTLAEAKSVTELTMQYPELQHPSFDATKAAAMYQQFSKEALAVFENYPEVKGLL